MAIVRYPPETVEEAVDYLRVHIAGNYEIPLLTTKKEDLDGLHFSLGAYAKGALGLWSGNEALIESCRVASGNKDIDVDDASMLIITLLWEKLQAENNTGLVSG
jgi:hypothetical protein